jgi:hypothetical protein
MRAVDEAVQRGVDAGCARVQVERAVRVQRHHDRVVVGARPVELLERQELLHIESGEAVELHRPQVAA